MHRMNIIFQKEKQNSLSLLHKVLESAVTAVCHLIYLLKPNLILSLPPPPTVL